MIEEITAKGILQKAGGGWFGADYNVNLYRGCSHGCIYCDSRCEVYGVENFDQVKVKKDAVSILEKELHTKRVKGIVGFGAMSDPYNPYERELRRTQSALLLMAQYGFGVTVTTKSPMLTRDIDLFLEISKSNPVLCKLTICGMDDAFAARVEPGAPPPTKRMEAIEALSKSGIYAGVLMMPVLPFLQDNEQNLRELLRAAAGSGARFVYPWFGMTLRSNQRAYFLNQIERLYPGMAGQYDRHFGLAYRCDSPKAEGLYRLTAELCQQYGLLWRLEDIVRDYKALYEKEQLSLFE